MKKFLPFLVFFVVLASGLHAQQAELLNTVIRRAARGIEETFPQGTMVAVINFASPSEAFSDYVVEELSGELVTGRKVTIVDRRSLTHIREEMNFQLSGDVSDESAQAIGKLLGAQFIVSGTLSNMGTFFRFRVRVINVETAVLQNQISLNLQNDSQVAFLLSGSQTGTPAPSTTPAVPSANTSAPAVSHPTPVQQTPPNQLRPGLYAEGVFQGAMYLMDAIDWIALNVKNGGHYIIVLGRDEATSGISLSYQNQQVNITLTTSMSTEITLRYDVTRPAASLITIGPGVVFTLENGIALVGLPNTSRSMVRVSGGSFIMNGGSIRDNSSTEGAGVYIDNGGFTMNNGTISGNRSSHGKNGGGIHIRDGTFTMNGGTISGNSTFYGNGGGVHIQDGTFSMNGGTISGNSARGGSGGGVFLRGSGTFQKSGTAGIIYGSNADEGQANKASEGGHAVVIRRGGYASVRNTTARVSQVMDSRQRGAAGGWE